MDERTFSISEAAGFFDKSPMWLRWRERQGVFTTSEGEPIVIARKPNEKQGGGDRRYTLDNLREIAKALRRGNVIDNRQLEVVLQRVDAFEERV